MHVTYLGRIQREKQLLPFIILHFDPVSQDLRIWFWCVWYQARTTHMLLMSLRVWIVGLLLRKGPASLLPTSKLIVLIAIFVHLLASALVIHPAMATASVSSLCP
jgi:hypothetical protein